MKKNLISLAVIVFLFSCGDTSVNVGGEDGGGGGTTYRQPANAIVITLRSWETTHRGLLGGKPDPRVYFNVNGVRGNSVVSSNTSEYLLNTKDIASWSGSVKSLPVRFAEDSDSIRIDAIAKAVGALWDTDISPGYFHRLRRPLYVGETGSLTFNYGSGSSKITCSYELVRW